MAHLLTQIFEVSKDIKGGGGNKWYGFSEVYEKKMIYNL